MAAAKKKYCSGCETTRAASRFSKNITTKDGLQDYCKLCYRAYCEANKERLQAKALAYRKNNKDAIALKTKIARFKKKQSSTDRVKAWRRRNPERSAKNSERATLLRQQRLTRAGPLPFKEAVDARMSMLGNKCFYCGGAYEEVEHTTPISRGGVNLLANLRPVCFADNRAKGKKTHKEYLAYLALAAKVRESKE